MQPFLSPSDDLLQLLAMTELFMLCLAGWIYFNTTDATLNGTQDTFVSICLIGITILFFVMFAVALLWAMRKLALKLYGKWQSSRQLQRDVDELAKLEQDRSDGKLPAMPADVKTAAPVPNTDAAPSKASYHFSTNPRSPSQLSARVAPVPPPLSASQVARAASSAGGSDSDSESGSGGDSDEDAASRHSAASPSVAGNQTSGRHTARSVSSSRGKDAWSVPATPTSRAPPPMLQRQSSKRAVAGGPGSEAPSPRSHSRLPLHSSRSPRPAQPAIAEEHEKEAADEQQDDGKDQHKEQPQPEEKQAASSSPLSSARPPPPSLGAGSAVAAAPRYELPPVVRPTRGSLDPSSAGPTASAAATPNSVQRTMTLAPLQPHGSPASLKKKKRKFVRAGDNFAQGQAVTNRLAVANPLKQLFNNP